MSSESQKRLRFSVIFDQHYDYVFHSLLRLGVRESDVEDVAHEMFLTVYRKLDDLDTTRSPKPWLFAFAARFAADHRRLARHRATGGDAELARLPSHDSPEEAASRAQTARLALGALEALTAELRTVFVAYELDELPMKEIALALEIPLNTAYSRLRLARAQFGAACAKLREEGTTA